MWSLLLQEKQKERRRFRFCDTKMIKLMKFSKVVQNVIIPLRTVPKLRDTILIQSSYYGIFRDLRSTPKLNKPKINLSEIES